MSPDRTRDPARWQLPLLVVMSASYESLFLHHGLNRIDEGWMLYAARQLHQGGLLYRDVFFGYPPGQLLPAWLGSWIDPPGVVAARAVNAAFATAMVVALYFLGRRVMPPAFALLGAAMLAVAAPDSHLWHYLFGYRFLIFSGLALLAFGRRLDGGGVFWTFAAGLLTGVAAVFRLEPAAAVGIALGIGVLAAGLPGRAWLRDAGGLLLGFLCSLVPVLAYLAHGVGLETLWNEVVVRAVLGSAAMSLPVPALELGGGFTRDAISDAFVALQFRLYPLLFGGYALALFGLWLRALARGERFQHVFLLTVVIWGGLYLTRAFGRSDDAHLDMTIPPPCLLLAHATGLLVRMASGARPTSGARRFASAGTVLGVLAAWILLLGADRTIGPGDRGTAPFASLGGRVYGSSESWARTLDTAVERIRSWTRPDQEILDLSASPILYVLAERNGAGRHDVLMPGTFLDSEEERRTIAELEASPPALVVWPGRAFDGDPERTVDALAPELARWVKENYALPGGRTGFFTILVPTPHGAD
ncbi:MAG: hypothetical protein ACE5FL_03015 [Myxococcota bacterium]